jgi:hypothetical protein
VIVPTPEESTMTQSSKFGPEPAAPAFPGKVVVVNGTYLMPVLTDCRFERIAGRTFLVGTDHGAALAAGAPDGLTRALAWDSDAVRDLVLFDSVEAVAGWRRKQSEDEIPF